MERKTTLKAMANSTIRDLEWAAGFMEGEGCFTVTNRVMRVTASQVNKEPVDRLLALFGGALKLKQPGKGAYKNTKPIWNWYISGSRARGVALTLYSLMSAKRQGQIRVAFA